MNRATIIGNLTKDPELKSTSTGKLVCSFTLAVKRPFGKDETDFIPCVVWDKKGENVAKYQTKGKRLAVSGRLQVRNYEANDGSKRYVTEIIADEVEFLSPMGDAQHQSKPEENDFEPLDESGMPF